MAEVVFSFLWVWGNECFRSLKFYLHHLYLDLEIGVHSHHVEISLLQTMHKIIVHWSYGIIKPSWLQSVLSLQELYACM